MEYRDIIKAAIVDAEFNRKSVSIDKDGYPIRPLPVDYNSDYEKALRTKKPEDIARFLKSWRTRTEIDLTKLEQHIKNKSEELRALENLDIVSVNLEGSLQLGNQSKPLRDVIIDLFNAFTDISQISRRDYTAASKVLHVLLPNLFVMWDRCIRCAYGCNFNRPEDAGEKYFKFLKRIQKEAREAVKSYCAKHKCSTNEAIQTIKEKLYEGGFYPFTKLLDQYNYQKYTIGNDRLWEKSKE